MLARRSLLIFVVNALGAVLGLVGIFAIGRYMNPSVYGQFTFALGLVGLASVLGNLGFDNAHVKRVSEGRALRACLGTYRRFKNGLTALFLGVTTTTVLVWHTTVGFFDATGVGVVLVVIVYYMLMMLRRYPEMTFNGFRMTANTQAMAVVENLVKVPLIVIAALLYGFLNGRWVPFQTVPATLAGWARAVGPLSVSQGAMLLAGAWAVGMLVSLVVGTVQMRRHGMQPGAYDAATARSYVQFALPIALAGSLMAIARHIDAVMLGYFWSDLEVGYYGVAQRLTTVVLIIPTAVRTLFYPLISELAAKGESSAVNEVAGSTQRIMSLVMVGVVATMVLFAAEGIHIFVADDFLPAAPVLQLMAVHTGLIAFTTVAASVVQGFDRPRATATIGIIGVFVNLGLNTVFIPDSFFGVPMLGLRAPGAALATVLSQVLVLALFAWMAHRITGRYYLSVSIVKHFVAAGTMAALLHLAADPLLGGVDRIWELAGAGVLAVAVYLGVLVLMRELTRRDLVLVRDLVNPGKMVGYVRDELRGQK